MLVRLIVFKQGIAGISPVLSFSIKLFFTKYLVEIVIKVLLLLTLVVAVITITNLLGVRLCITSRRISPTESGGSGGIKKNSFPETT